MDFADGSHLPVDLVVFATGVRPRDELAREAGLAIGERGGIVVDEACATTAPDVFAIGEVACIEGRTWGLVAPGYTMAEIVADRLLGGAATFPGADISHQAQAPRRRRRQLRRRVRTGARRPRGRVRRPGGRRLQEAGHVRRRADPARRRTRRGRQCLRLPAPDGRARSSVPTRPHGCCPRVRRRRPPTDLPDAANVCSCNNVDAGTIRCAVSEQGCTDLAGVKACTRAGTSCGSCLPLVKKLVTTELEKSGVTVSNALCEHFELSRAQLFDVVRVQGLAHLQRDHRAPRHRPRLRHLPPGVRLHPGQPRQGSRARPRHARGCRTPTTT